MTGEEVKEAIEMLKAEGNTDDEILGACYLMFADDILSFEDLELCANALGYEIADEFRNMSPEDQKTKGYSRIDEDDNENESNKSNKKNRNKRNKR